MTHAIVHLITGVWLLAAGILLFGIESQSHGLRELLRQQKNDRLLWVLAWGCAVVDPIVSLLPTPVHLAPITLPDKLLHFFAYMTMTAAFLLAGVHRPGRGKGKWPEAAGVITLAIVTYGGLMELLQMLVGRDGQVLDQVANMLGCMAGALLWRNLIQSDAKPVTDQPSGGVLKLIEPTLWDLWNLRAGSPDNESS